MPADNYSVNQHPVSTLLAWAKSGEIAIPEIQRPFVWSAAKVRDFIDSLYRGYPVGYIIVWRNPNVLLKDGSRSVGKRILIDGQQRMTALMATLLGREVVDKNYRKRRIAIAFHPGEERFEVANPAIRKSREWLADIRDVFAPDAKILQLVKRHCASNPAMDENQVYECMERLRGINNNHLGVIELSPNLDMDTVAEIFVRINSQGGLPERGGLRHVQDGGQR